MLRANLRKQAPTPQIDLPAKQFNNQVGKTKGSVVLKASVDSLDTEAELTAYGVMKRTGTIIVKLPADSPLAEMGFKVDDVVLKVGGNWTSNRARFSGVFSSKRPKIKSGKSYEAVVWRNQQEHRFTFTAP